MYPPLQLSPSAKKCEFVHFPHFCGLVSIFEPQRRKSGEADETSIYRMLFMFRLMKEEDMSTLTLNGLEALLRVILTDMDHEQIRHGKGITQNFIGRFFIFPI